MMAEQQRLPFADLRDLFAARSVAIVGASANPKKPSGMLMAFLAHAGFDGAVYPVNPREETIAGYDCYPDIAALPEKPDVAVVAVPVSAVGPVLQGCADAGIAYAVVMTGGFGEGQTGGEGLQRADELRSLIDRTGLRVVGPNTVGMVNFHRGLPLTFADWYGRDSGARGGVAVLTHSGSVGGLMFGLLQKAGIGIHSWVGLGNEVNLDASDFIAHYAEDPDVSAVCCFLEAVHDGDKFRAVLAQAMEKETAVLIAKAGRSAAGRRATLSHTGNLSSPGQTYSAVFDKYGVVEVASLGGFASALRLLGSDFDETTDLASAVGILAASGGACSLLADHLSAEGLSVPGVEPEVSAALATAIPDYGSRDNPVDLTADVIHRSDILEDTIEALQGGGTIGTWVVFGRALIDRYYDRLGQAAKRSELPNIVACPGIEMEPEVTEALRQSGIPVIDDPAECARALAAVTGRQRTSEGDSTRALPARPRGAPVHPQRAEDALRPHGLPLPRTVYCSSPTEAHAAIADGRIGFPVAVKVAAAEVQHKTELGGLALDVNDGVQLDRAISAVSEVLASEAIDGTEPPGIQVQEMVGGDVELLVSLTQDADFGPIITIGMGGTMTELLRDTVVLVPPFSRDAVLKALRSLRSWPLLAGYRNSAPSDSDSIIDLIENLCKAYRTTEWLAELEFNPVLVDSAGATIVDVLAIASARSEG